MVWLLDGPLPILNNSFNDFIADVILGLVKVTFYPLLRTLTTVGCRPEG